ncbi:glycosyltransferase [Microbacterium sp. 22215]|uniref:glycosyltransferase n=1 Tax=Microbacterium sp. 22215 TaxID=3453893 RepID=UPI003F84289B
MRKSFDDPAEITLYSFWGLGGGLAVPWLVDDARRSFVRVHRYDLYELPGYLPFRAHLYSSIDGVLAVSTHARDYIAERHPDAHIIVSRLGTSDPGSIPESRRDDRPPLVVSCSHVIPVKRVERILDAVSAVGQEMDVRWVHFGGGTDLPELTSKVRAVGVDVDLRGQTPHEEVIEFYRREYVDAFINLSESEGVPVSIMEAMSFNIPIVATDVGGTGEIVTAQAGRLVGPSATTEEVATTVSEVLRLRESFRSREVWAQRCDSDRNSRATARVLRGLSGAE